MARPRALARPVGLGPGDHAAWALDGAADAAACASSYLGEGVRRGERVVLVARSPADSAAVVAGWPERDRLLDARQLVITSADEAYRPLREDDAHGQVGRFAHDAEQALADGWAGLRVWSDVSAMVGSDRMRQAFLDYETALAGTFRECPLTGVCALDRPAAGEAWDRFAGRHAVRRDRPESPPLAVQLCGDVVRLVGEVDLCGLDVLVDGLDSARRASTGRLVVDLSELEFLDVAAARALARTTAELAGVGRDVRVRGADRTTARVLSLFGLLGEAVK